MREDRRRKKEETKKYEKTHARQSVLGKRSCIYGIFTLLLFLLCVMIAFRTRGAASGFVGGLGFIAIVLSIIGLRDGIRGLKDRDRRHGACRIGILLNGLILALLAVILIGGFF